MQLSESANDLTDEQVLQKVRCEEARFVNLRVLRIGALTLQLRMHVVNFIGSVSDHEREVMTPDNPENIDLETVPEPEPEESAQSAPKEDENNIEEP
jgi:hypothetical protein